MWENITLTTNKPLKVYKFIYDIENSFTKLENLHRVKINKLENLASCKFKPTEVLNNISEDSESGSVSEESSSSK